MFYRCHKSANWTFLTKRKMSLCDWAPTENGPSELVRRLKLIDTLWNVCFRCPLAKQPPALMSHLSSHVVVFIGLILQIFFPLPPLSLTVACCFLAWARHFDVKNLSVICCCTVPYSWNMLRSALELIENLIRDSERRDEVLQNGISSSRTNQVLF